MAHHNPHHQPGWHAHGIPQQHTAPVHHTRQPTYNNNTIATKNPTPKRAPAPAKKEPEFGPGTDQFENCDYATSHHNAFGYHTETFQSTVSDLCVESCFVTPHPQPENLLVASNNILRVYRLAQLADGDKLEVLATFPFYGSIQSMQTVRLGNASRDTLLLTFLDAKLSVLEFDPATYDLKTVSMHAFEDEATRNGCYQRIGFPEVKVDPDRRCAVMMVYRTKFIVLPFAADDPKTDSDKKTQISSKFRSYVIDCAKLDPPIRNLVDFVMLEGYNEPTLVVLYEPVPAWPGRYASTRDTKAIAALSLNMHEKETPINLGGWSWTDLPSDSLRLIEIPPPIGGVLVAGANCLYYLNQATPAYGVSLNSHADKWPTSLLLRKQEDAVLTLDCSCHVWISDTRIVFALKNGDLYLLSLITDGRTLERFKFERLASSVLVHCICAVGKSHLFLGSRLGNSLLLRYSEIDSTVDTSLPLSPPSTTTTTTTATDDDGAATKKSKVEKELIDDPYADDFLTQLYYDDENLSNVRTTFKLETADSVLNIGPLASSEASLVEGLPARDPMSYQAVTCTGYGKNGGLTIVHRSIRPHTIMATRDVSVGDSCIDLWTVYGQSTDNVDKHAYLVLGKAEDTLVVGTTGGSLDQVDESSGFSSHTATIFVGNMCRNERIVQVCAHSILLIKNEDLVEEIPMSEDSDIVAACVCDPYLLVRFQDGGVSLFKIDDTGNQLELTHRLEADEDPVVACDLYNDVGNMFCFQTEVDTIQTAKSAATKSKLSSGKMKKEKDELLSLYDVDDDDDNNDNNDNDDNNNDATNGLNDDNDINTDNNDNANDNNDDDVGDVGDVSDDVGKAHDDDDEEMANLYEDEPEEFDAKAAQGKANAQAKANANTKSKHSDNVNADGDTSTAQSGGGGVWCALVRQSGRLDVVQVVDFFVRFTIKNFMMIPKLLKDAGLELTAAAVDENDELKTKSQKKTASGFDGIEEAPLVTEICLCAFARGTRPHLMCTLNSGHMAVYEVFPYFHEGGIHERFVGRIQVRMKKVDCPIFLRDLKSFQEVPLIPSSSDGAHGSDDDDDVNDDRDDIRDDDDDNDIDDENDDDGSSKKKNKAKKVVTTLRRRCLRPYTDINGIEGVFVCSTRPFWLMFGKRNVLRLHPMWESTVEAFTPFNSIHCERGYVALCNGELRIARLLPYLAHDAQLITYKIPLKKTASHIVHHKEENVYAMVTFSKIPIKTAPLIVNEDPPEDPPEVPRDPRWVPAMESKYQLDLVSPVNWTVIPNTTIDVERHEMVSCCAMVKLESQEHISGKREYIAVGVTRVCGEEVTARGRLLIIDVLDVVPEPGLPLTKNKMKIIYKEVQKGAVTAISSVNGFLAVATGYKDGAKVYIYYFQNKDTMVGIAFADAETYVNNLRSLRSFLIGGDLFQSTSVFRFSQLERFVEDGEDKIEGQLTRIAKDIYPMGSGAVEFFVNDDYLGFISCDDLGNMQVYSYVPDDESEGGRTLKRRADFHLGSHVTTMFRLAASSSAMRADELFTDINRHAVCYGTKEGSMGVLLPIQETLYRRLYMLQNKLNTGLQHRAGLNPKAYRMISTNTRRKFNIQRNILDGELLREFLMLGIIEQREFGRRIGTGVDEIITDLCDLFYDTTIL